MRCRAWRRRSDALPWRSDKLAFLPPPADGGLAAAAAFQVLQHDPAGLAAAQARADAVVAPLARRAAGIAAAVAGPPTAAAGSLPPLPASTTFATLDHNGNAVVCALTMDNLFGTGRDACRAPGSCWRPRRPPCRRRCIAAAMAWNEPTHAFRAAVGGSGQAAARRWRRDGAAQGAAHRPGDGRAGARSRPGQRRSTAPATCRTTRQAAAGPPIRAARAWRSASGR